MKTIIPFFCLVLLASCKSTKQTDVFKFEKIVYHTSACFGYCPSYHMEIRSDKTVRLKGDSLRAKRMPNIDQSRVGNFTGIVNDALFEKMLKDLREIGLDTVQFKGPNCCDAPIRTIIVYYNGKRKYMRAMFPPDHALSLIATMSDIYSTGKFEPAVQSFEIEYDSIPR